MHSYFSDRQKPSMNTLSSHWLRPFMETRMPAAVNTSVNRGLVNWLPWSVLKISGVPKRAIASYSASMEGPPP